MKIPAVLLIADHLNKLVRSEGNSVFDVSNPARFFFYISGLLSINHAKRKSDGNDGMTHQTTTCG